MPQDQLLILELLLSLFDYGMCMDFLDVKNTEWMWGVRGVGGGRGLAILKWYEMIDVTSFEFPFYYISSWLNSITVFITFISYVYWFDIFRLRYTCMQRFKNVPGWRGGGGVWDITYVNINIHWQTIEY